MEQKTDFAFMKSLQERFSIVRALDPKQLIPPARRFQYSVKQLTVGSFFRLHDSTYYVRSIGTCQEYDEAYEKKQNYVMTEFRCLDLGSGDTVYMEWEEDDELETFVGLSRLTFKDLTDDQGEAVDEDDLDQIVDDNDTLLYQGKVYRYDDDWAAVYTPAGGKKTEKVYIYEFEAKDGTGLTVEEWGGGKKSSDYEIWISRKENADAFEILSLGGETVAGS